MPVNVGEIVSTVSLEEESADQSGGAREDWQRVAEARASLARMLRDRLRTAAEGFDD